MIVLPGSTGGKVDDPPDAILVPAPLRDKPAPGLPASGDNKANMTALATDLTRALELRIPVVSAPMAFAAGGALAAAVSRAGGLGLIGGGYGDAGWLEQQFAAAKGERVGVGFITWSLRKSSALLAGADVSSHRGPKPAATVPCAAR
jgi:hypothetical protein